ncbi:hypothetical protein ACGFJC_47380 [Nonomuraea fuscirosea]|uniref:hypothetical protein n=1 Tax=Nonomuraea fuscirosea TaxID=1291556 RepID=UPI0037190F8B
MSADKRRPLPDVEDDISLDHGVGPTASRTVTEPRTGAYESGGTQEAGNGRQEATESREEGDEPERSTRDRTTSTRNRGKADNSRGGGRGRARQPSAIELSKAERDDWRWRLRSLAGKLKADEQALQETEDRWELLLKQARETGVPDTMMLVALMDAGVSDPDRYL